MNTYCTACGSTKYNFGCPDCKRIFLASRNALVAQAETEIGPLAKDTHTAIVHRVKQLERETETERRERFHAYMEARRKL